MAISFTEKAYFRLMQFHDIHPLLPSLSLRSDRTQYCLSIDTKSSLQQTRGTGFAYSATRVVWKVEIWSSVKGSRRCGTAKEEGTATVLFLIGCIQYTSGLRVTHCLIPHQMYNYISQLRDTHYLIPYQMYSLYMRANL